MKLLIANPLEGSTRSLTRVVLDDECDVEVAQLPQALARIHHALRDVSGAQRDYIAKALFGFAVSSLKRGRGSTPDGIHRPA